MRAPVGVEVDCCCVWGFILYICVIAFNYFSENETKSQYITSVDSMFEVYNIIERHKPLYKFLDSCSSVCLIYNFTLSPFFNIPKYLHDVLTISNDPSTLVFLEQPVVVQPACIFPHSLLHELRTPYKTPSELIAHDILHTKFVVILMKKISTHLFCSSLRNYFNEETYKPYNQYTTVKDQFIIKWFEIAILDNIHEQYSENVVTGFPTHMLLPQFGFYENVMLAKNYVNNFYQNALKNGMQDFATDIRSFYEGITGIPNVCRRSSVISFSDIIPPYLHAKLVEFYGHSNPILHNIYENVLIDLPRSRECVIKNGDKMLFQFVSERIVTKILLYVKNAIATDTKNESSLRLRACFPVVEGPEKFQYFQSDKKRGGTKYQNNYYSASIIAFKKKFFQVSLPRAKTRKHKKQKAYTQQTKKRFI